MPQIPEPQIGSLPGREQPAEMIDSRPVEESLSSGAGEIAGQAGQLEAAQKKRDDAELELQKRRNAVKALAATGAYSEKLGNAAQQLQKQYWDSPEEYPEALRKASLDLTQNEISAVPDQSGDLALDMGRQYAEENNKQLGEARNWMTRRMAQQTKSTFTQIGQSQVRAAQATTTLPGLALALKDTDKKVGALAPSVTFDPDTAVSKIKHDMVAGWVEANSTQYPASVQAALADKKGPLGQYLSAKEIAEYTKRLPGVQKKAGEDAREQIVREAIDQGAQVFDAMRQGQIDSKNLFQMKIAVQNKKLAIERNPQLTPDEKTEQGKLLGMQFDTLRWAEDAATAPASGDTDEKLTAKLFDRLGKLSAPTDKTPKDLYEVFKLQHDVFEAQAKGEISADRAKVLHDSLRMTMGAGKLSEGSPRAPRGLPAQAVNSRTPRWAGQTSLENYLDSGAFGKLDDAQKNQARHDFYAMLAEATQSHANLDAKAAQQLAFNAVRGVARHGRKGK